MRNNFDRVVEGIVQKKSLDLHLASIIIATISIRKVLVYKVYVNWVQFLINRASLMKPSEILLTLRVSHMFYA